MGMQMNIKSDEAYRLASELAALEKVSLTQAVLNALRARQKELAQAEKLERVMAIARDIRSRLGPDFFDVDHGDLLYDEMGLPK